MTVAAPPCGGVVQQLGQGQCQVGLSLLPL